MPNGLTDTLLNWQTAWPTDCRLIAMNTVLLMEDTALHCIINKLFINAIPCMSFYFIKFHGSHLITSSHVIMPHIMSCFSLAHTISYHVMKTPFISFSCQLVNAIAHVKLVNAITHVNYCFSSCKVHHASCIVHHALCKVSLEMKHPHPDALIGHTYIIVK